MFFIKTKRVIKSGFLNFWRNGWISLAAILIMVITLFSVGSIVFSSVVFSSILNKIQDKVDISVYFKTDAEEKEILALKKELEVLPEVKAVAYVSAEQSLADFKERHKDNALIAQSVEELDSNPLGAILNIKAKEVSQYDAVANFLKDETEGNKGVTSLIDKVNYYENKDIIDNLTRILASTRRLGAVVSVIFALISILVVFNTLGLVIYASREEIEVMRLVGASNRFVRGPFIIEGAIYGVVATLVTMIIYYPVTIWLGPITRDFFAGVDVYKYYIANFGQIFLVLLGLGVALGVISSLIATRRYLKV